MTRKRLLIALGMLVVAAAVLLYWIRFHRRDSERMRAMRQSLQLLSTDDPQWLRDELRARHLDLKQLQENNEATLEKQGAFAGFQAVISSTFKPVPIVAGRLRFVLAQPVTPLTPPLSAQDQGSVARIGLSVGRVERVDDAGAIHLVGTAFMAGPGMVATNCHVVAELLTKTGDPVLAPNVPVRVDFGDSRQHDPAHEFTVTGVSGCPTRTGMDVGMLTIQTLALDVQSSPPGVLTIDDAKFSPHWGNSDARIGLVGYPDLDHTDESLYQALEATSPKTYGKIFTPGVGQGIDNARGFDFLLHNGSSDSGNSGSPIFDLTNFHVVGVHNCCYSSTLATPTGPLRLPCSFVFGQARFNQGVAGWEVRADPALGGLLPHSPARPKS